MKNKSLASVLSLILLLSAYNLKAQPPELARQRVSLDMNWRFHLGDIPFLAPMTHDQTYNDSKAGNASGAAAVKYNDRDWQTLTLPHDWSAGLGFDSTLNVSEGYRHRGIGWYRRTFRLDSADRGKHLELQFDGIATFSTIWVNGTLVNRNWCGYTSSYIDITQLAHYGGEPNVIAVRVDANAHEGWWYEGAGIYRHTWLLKTSPVHIVTDGVYANPILRPDGSWLIPAEVILDNSGKQSIPVEVEIGLYDSKGNMLDKTTTTTLVKDLHQSVAKLSLSMTNPSRWTLEHPILYTVKAIVKQNGIPIDEEDTRCGFRTLRFDADSGFFLNGLHVKLKGVCNHQDHAGVGVAVPDALWEFRLRKLKEMGVNAYRCAHNPPAAEFLQACDSMGILVMDENRNFNTSPEYIRQLQWMVQRDRNHPSIILWSVFNEEPMQGTENGYEMVRYMSARVKDLDSTRPVTAAQSGGQLQPVNVSQAVDVVGFNYQQYSYDEFHKRNPTMKMTSSEDASGLMERGVYVTDKNRHLIDAYDLQAPDWGSTHRKTWKMIDERPFLAGCFIWTGFDYHGEPTPYTWPTAGSFFGCMDLCGFPKTAFWLHQAQWRDDIDVLQLVPGWNWPADSIGKKIRVMALSNADSVKLVLNGKTISGQKVDKYEMNTWFLPYAPGKLEAFGYKKGKIVSRYATETTGEPVTLQLIADRAGLKNDGRDAMPVTVQVLDSKGRPVPTANVPVKFELSGGGRIIGLGNGDPNSHEPEKGDSRSLFNGLAQVIVQSNEGATSPLVLTAVAPGLKPATITIPVHPVAALPFVE
jgi:beta-galactosidase